MRGSARRHAVDAQDVARAVVAEGGRGPGRRDRERDVRPVRRPARAVVEVPRLVERDLALVAAGREDGRLERVGAVAVGILEPASQAVRCPVAGAAERGLEVARRDRDHGVLAAGDPVALVVVVELDARPVAGERDVGPALLGEAAVVLVPGAVEGDLVLEAAGGDDEAALPHVVRGVVRQVRGGARRVPVAAAAQLVLEAADDGDRRRVRRVRGERAGRRQRGGRGEGQERREVQDQRHEEQQPAADRTDRSQRRGEHQGTSGNERSQAYARARRRDRAQAQGTGRRTEAIGGRKRGSGDASIGAGASRPAPPVLRP